jgi:hypothetical protein
MPNRSASVLTCAAWLAATTALAQPAGKSPPAATVAPVTVEGVAPPKVVYERARKFVQSFAKSASPEINQIGRWRDPVCVEAIGLIGRQETYVQQRISDVAKAVGLHIQGAGCRPNIEIVFTDAPQPLMDLVAKRDEALLGYYHRHEHDRLKTVTRPIQAWYVTATAGKGPSAGWGNQLQAEVIDDPENPGPDGCGDSPRFTGCYQSVFKNIFVVVDTSTLKIDNLGLVADYLVMLALAEPKSLDGCNALPSVIDLVPRSECQNRDPPDGLTPSDAAYLTSLYQSDPEGRRWVQEGEITERMAKILIAANAVKR